MKKCNSCNEVKSLDDFYRDKSNERRNKTTTMYYKSTCKVCTVEALELWRLSKKDGHHSVYYLPEEHYVGMTDCMYSRMRAHGRDGKITEGYEVMATFERSVDAHWFETMCHQRGYRGYQYEGK